MLFRSSPPPEPEKDDSPTLFGWDSAPAPEFEEGTLLDDSLEDSPLAGDDGDGDGDEDSGEDAGNEK